ncbi:hypothetical protein [Sporosarcina sp. FSL K6-3457]|uniref:hypothetical protein n=1 Tax=Sporosarcina sp. FSL K6-3457 TaxID=2978204 RepID=UPI0030FC7BB1
MLMFNCYTCGQKFKIANENLFNKITIQCPNCDNPVPQKAVEALRRYSEAYMDFIDVLYHTNAENKSWGISVVETESPIPQNPNDYFHQKPYEGDSFWRHRKKPFVRVDAQVDINDPDLPF